MKKNEKLILGAAAAAGAWYFFLRPKPSPGSGGSFSGGGGLFDTGELAGAEETLDLAALLDSLWERILGDPTLNLADVHGGGSITPDGEVGGAFDLAAFRDRAYSRLEGDSYDLSNVHGGGDADALERVLAFRRNLAYQRVSGPSYDLSNVHGPETRSNPLQAFRDRVYGTVSRQSDLPNVHGSDRASDSLQAFRDRVYASVTRSSNLADVHGGGSPPPSKPKASAGPPRDPIREQPAGPPRTVKVTRNDDRRGPRGG